MMADVDELVVRDAARWRSWLTRNHATSPGVWLVLAKKDTIEPTRLTYDQALEEALCHGWIDGQLRRRDSATYYQRFTRRRQRSAWSKRNIAIAERLTAEGRMHPAGFAELASAKADGRSAAAYAGSASIEVPPDLVAALAAEPRAQAMFDALTRQNRYAVLYRIDTAKRPETRKRRIQRLSRCSPRAKPSTHERNLVRPTFAPADVALGHQRPIVTASVSSRLHSSLSLSAVR
jgi:uncharacterized protein YdeI (YjbR/CyaY-like superfamily)